MDHYMNLRPQLGQNREPDDGVPQSGHGGGVDDSILRMYMSRIIISDVNNITIPKPSGTPTIIKKPSPLNALLLLNPAFNHSIKDIIAKINETIPTDTNNNPNILNRLQLNSLRNSSNISPSNKRHHKGNIINYLLKNSKAINDILPFPETWNRHDGDLSGFDSVDFTPSADTKHLYISDSLLPLPERIGVKANARRGIRYIDSERKESGTIGNSDISKPEPGEIDRSNQHHKNRLQQRFHGGERNFQLNKSIGAIGWCA